MNDENSVATQDRHTLIEQSTLEFLATLIICVVSYSFISGIMEVWVFLPKNVTITHVFHSGLMKFRNTFVVTPDYPSKFL